MNPETLFLFFNMAVLPGWLLLAAAPHHRWTSRIVHSGAYSLALGVPYLLLALLFFGRSPGDFNTLRGVQQLFANPYLLLAGWIHYLAFDLWVGSWIVRDAKVKGVRQALVVPCLGLTLFFGPVGFLAYHLVRFKSR
jgi:hypothetical protein